MTRALPSWTLILDLGMSCRRSAFDPRHWRGVHGGARKLQIVNGMTSFLVTACRNGVITIDISCGREWPNFGTTGNTKQAWQRKYSVDLSSDAYCCIGRRSAKAVQPKAGRNRGGAYTRKIGGRFGREQREHEERGTRIDCVLRKGGSPHRRMDLWNKHDHGSGDQGRE